MQTTQTFTSLTRPLPRLSTLYRKKSETRHKSFNFKTSNMTSPSPEFRRDLDAALALIAKLRAEKEDALLRLEQLRRAHLDQQEVRRI